MGALVKQRVRGRPGTLSEPATGEHGAKTNSSMEPVLDAYSSQHTAQAKIKKRHEKIKKMHGAGVGCVLITAHCAGKNKKKGMKK